MIYTVLALFLAGVAILGYVYGFRLTGSPGGTGAGPGAPDPSVGLLALRWDALYESGHPLLDAQHRLLFDSTNELLGAVAGTGAGSTEAAYRIHVLLDHAARHFEVEEELLRQAGYPKLPAHISRHQDLLNCASRLRAEAKEGRLDWYQLLSFLSQDLVFGHMVIDDRECSGLFRDSQALAAGDGQPDPLSPEAARMAATRSSVGQPLER